MFLSIALQPGPQRRRRGISVETQPKRNLQPRPGRYLLEIIWIRQVRIAHAAQRGGMDKVEMPGDELRKGGLGMVGGVFPHKGHVVGDHPPIA